MKLRNTISAMMKALCAAWALVGAGHAAYAAADRVETVVDEAIQPLMAKDHIPGMAVGVIVAGRPRVFNYGVASTQTGQPVTNRTLFELGSVSKTLTATLASLADVDHQLSLSDSVSQYLPSLDRTPFGRLSLLELGTHTPGGLPLQVPDDIRDEAGLMRYFRAWRPAHVPGTYRTYSNVGIGTLGLITADRMGQDFTRLMQGRLFPALGLQDSFIDVPAAREADYAQGYTKQGQPVRMTGGVLAPQAYGVKSTAADMLRFIAGNMKLGGLDPTLQRALTQTHTGYFKAGPLTQDLVWEQYPYPVALTTLLAGNGPAMIFDGSPATRLQPPEAPRGDVWINKTGSTSGFGSYVAFIPDRRLGIVILGNRNFPIEDRVAAAYRILRALDATPQ